MSLEIFGLGGTDKCLFYAYNCYILALLVSLLEEAWRRNKRWGMFCGSQEPPLRVSLALALTMTGLCLLFSNLLFFDAFCMRYQKKFCYPFLELVLVLPRKFFSSGAIELFTNTIPIGTFCGIYL